MTLAGSLVSSMPETQFIQALRRHCFKLPLSSTAIQYGVMEKKNGREVKNIHIFLQVMVGCKSKESENELAKVQERLFCFFNLTQNRFSDSGGFDNIAVVCSPGISLDRASNDALTERRKNTDTCVNLTCAGTHMQTGIFESFT